MATKHSTPKILHHARVTDFEPGAVFLFICSDERGGKIAYPIIIHGLEAHANPALSQVGYHRYASSMACLATVEQLIDGQSDFHLFID